MKTSRFLLPLLLLSCLVLPPAPSATAVAAGGNWEKEIAAFETADQAQPPPRRAIIFLGSSSMRLWKTLAEDFPNHRVINRGFGGSQLADSVHFLERIVFPHEPRMIVLYAGGNDINAGKAPEQVLADFKTFVANARAKLPEVEIAFVSIAGNPKRWAQVERVRIANGMIEAFIREQPRIKFINVFPEMLGADGLPKPEIFVADRLHMNAEGYKIWTKVIGPLLPPADK